MMAGIVYSLCTLTSATCFGLLLREYLRNRGPLLLWTSLCFFGLFVSNVVLLFDRFVFPPEVSLANYRVIPTLLGFGALIFGLISERNET